MTAPGQATMSKGNDQGYYFWIDRDFRVDCNPATLDIDWIVRELSQSYWAEEIPKTTVIAAIEGSTCFGLFKWTDQINQQIGFARVITDRATFAWVTDVFISPDFRGQGLGDWLLSCVRNHPDLLGLRRWLLATRDAHGFYEKHAFQRANADRLMTIHDPAMYKKNK